jgi:hypothetical protein
MFHLLRNFMNALAELQSFAAQYVLAFSEQLVGSMRRSSQIGFGASIGLAIFSASFVTDFSSERSRLFFWSQASAGMPSAATMSIGPARTAVWSDSPMLSSKIRRQALLNHVQQKLSRGSDAVTPILP